MIKKKVTVKNPLSIGEKNCGRLRSGRKDKGDSTDNCIEKYKLNWI